MAKSLRDYTIMFFKSQYKHGLEIRKAESMTAGKMHEFEPLSGKVIAAAVAVHRALGPGFLESVYQNAMSVALRNRFDFIRDSEGCCD